MTGDRRSLWLGAAVAAAVALVFHSVLGLGFLTGDDAVHVSANALLRGPLGTLWTSPFQVPGLYMPATYSVWWAAGRAGSMDPIYFHALNWIFHSLNVFLAYLCFERAGLSALGAVFAAALFGLHPIQVESVAWVTAFKDVFAGTFVLLCLWLALKDRWVGASAAFVVALLCKPVAAVTPALVAAFLWGAGQPLRKRAPFLGAWLALSAALLAWTKALQPGPTFPLWSRAQIAVDALGFSLAKAIVPIGLGLNYGRTPNAVLSHGVGATSLALVLAAGLLWTRRADRKLLAGAGIFLIPWLPVSGAVSFFHQIHSTTADRFLYLSLLGLGLAAGGLLENKKGFATVLTAGLALLSTIQLSHWRSEAALYGRMARINPSAENHYRHAMALVAEQRPGEATAALKRALSVNPADPRFANNLALLQAEQGRAEEAERELREALSYTPDSATLKANLDTLVRRRLSQTP